MSRKRGEVRARVPCAPCDSMAPRLDVQLTIVRGQGGSLDQPDTYTRISPHECRSMGDARFAYFRFRGHLRNVRMVTVSLLKQIPREDVGEGEGEGAGEGAGEEVQRVRRPGRRRVVPVVALTRYFVVQGATHQLKRFAGGATRHEYTLVPTLPSFVSSRVDRPPPHGSETVLRARCPTTKKELDHVNDAGDYLLRNRLVKNGVEWEFVWEHGAALEKEQRESASDMEEPGVHNERGNATHPR